MIGVRGLFTDPIHPNIRGFLDEEQDRYDKKNPTVFQKTPWIRLTSNATNVFVQDGAASGGEYREVLASDWVLFGGKVTSLDKNTKQNLPEEIHINPLTGWSLDGNGVQYGYNRRNLPRPGIESVNVLQRGGLGSVTKASISIIIPYERDLEIIEKLYMVPGVSLILEYGWSDYAGGIVSSEIDKVNDTFNDIQDKIIKKTIAVSTINENLTTRTTPPDSKEAGKYGGMIGVIYKYSYSANTNGGYNVNVEILSKNFFYGRQPLSTKKLPLIQSEQEEIQ
jgi:hypothetical protein